MPGLRCRAKDPAACVRHNPFKSAADVRVSKGLAYVLRHDPGSVGLKLSPGGWVAVADLAAATGVSEGQVRRLAALDEKGRFTVSGGRIRAAQGHSVPVRLGHQPSRPPAVLYHGTVVGALGSIFASGLTRQSRQAVHLSASVAEAVAVGARRGKPVVLVVDALRLQQAGHVFTRAANGVWLTDAVPAAYLRLLHDQG